MGNERSEKNASERKIDGKIKSFDANGSEIRITKAMKWKT
jgi:hypothetical protein